MPEKPPAPDGLPKYIAEGIPKQHSADLRNLQDWIDELIEYRQGIEPEEISAGPNETIEKTEPSSKGTIVYKKVTCGSKGCHCEDGELHGPYKYRVTWVNGKQKWKSLGPVGDTG